MSSSSSSGYSSGDGSSSSREDSATIKRRTESLIVPGRISELDRTLSYGLATGGAELSERVASTRSALKDGRMDKKDVDSTIKREVEMTDHLIPIDQLLDNLKANTSTGLTESNARERLAVDGPNAMTPPEQEWWLKSFLVTLFGGFSMLLWVGAILCFISKILDDTQNENMYLGFVLVGVVTLTALFEFYQEAKAAKIVAGFTSMVPQHCEVLRDGKKGTIDPKDLVCGDIVFVKSGSKVPADIRIISANGLKVDNSSLTGETDPQPRDPKSSDDNPLESSNLAFYTSLVLEGEGTGVVIRTGDDTVIGHISALVQTTDNEQTPIRREINHFIIIIAVIAVALGILFFAIGFAFYSFITNMVFAIGIIVANVPEGLIATVTVSLTLTAKRMATKNVLVKNLESVETLGSTSCICSDKTGTLTQNKMSVSHLWFDNEMFTADTTVRKASYDPSADTFQAITLIAGVCNKAVFELKAPDGEDSDDPNVVKQRVPIGDASESALIRFTDPLFEGGVENERARHGNVASIPFNSKNKYAVEVVRDKAMPKFMRDGGIRVLMKGAPERIIARCDKILLNGNEVDMEDEHLEAFQAAYEELGGEGERVLGFCMRSVSKKYFPSGFSFDPQNPEFPLDGMTFVGLISLVDPPRPSVPKAISNCRTASIKVIMVTGDHPSTAHAIAKQVNIITKKTRAELAKERGCAEGDVPDADVDAIVVTGEQLKELSDAELRLVLLHEQIVFARTSPQQKLQIVEGCQNLGHIVAVTGDGVNDSPALKKANIGVAMGIAGSDVSKEAADMILLDDNFASIVNGVEEGRLIFDNLKKSIAYTLSSNIPEIMPFILFIILRMPIALPTILILFVDLGTDLLPAISLAYEKPEDRIMLIPPRNAQTDHLVTNKLISFSYLLIGAIQACAGFAAYFAVLNDFGFPPWSLMFVASDWLDTDAKVLGYDYEYRSEALAHAQTAYFVSIVVVQWADLLVCKTRRNSIFQQGMWNWMLNLGLLFETVLALALVYLPFMTSLGLRPIRFVHWLPGLPFAVFIFVFDEVRKAIMRRYPGGWLERNTLY